MVPVCYLCCKSLGVATHTGQQMAPGACSAQVPAPSSPSSSPSLIQQGSRISPPLALGPAKLWDLQASRDRLSAGSSTQGGFWGCDLCLALTDPPAMLSRLAREGCGTSLLDAGWGLTPVQSLCPPWMPIHCGNLGGCRNLVCKFPKAREVGTPLSLHTHSEPAQLSLLEATQFAPKHGPQPGLLAPISPTH